MRSLDRINRVRGPLVERVTSVSLHRNGISGEPFHVVVFEAVGGDSKMLAVMFDGPGQVAVLDLDLLEEAIIEFGENSFRGDDYEPELRVAVMNAEEIVYQSAVDTGPIM
jgi:hypothetical protein